jgi:Rrf2 family protein
MTINQATDYAFRAVQYLAQSDERVVDARQIAQSEAIPMRFLLRIMPSLIQAGIVASHRGAGGGYSLARDPRQITFLDVVEAVEGPVYVNRCQKDYEYCSKHGAPACAIHQKLNIIQSKISEELRQYNFGDLKE